ncbi:MAG: transglutaminase domain-containing protein [Pirellulaceae bacterium]
MFDKQRRIQTIMLFAIGLLVGCDRIPSRPPIGTQAEAEQRVFSEVTRPETIDEEDAASPKIADIEVHPEAVAPMPIEQRDAEYWEAYLVGREQVGFSCTKLEAFGERDEFLRYTMEEQLRVRRGEQVSRQWLKQTSLETIDGIFQQFESELSADGSIVLSQGKIGYEQLPIVVQRDGQSQTTMVPWTSKYHGPFGIQQSLLAEPMKPKQDRWLHALLPLQHQVGTIHLHSTDVINVAMMQGESQKLLEIECKIEVDGRPILDRLLWTNDDGEILKSYTPVIDFTSVRVDRETATQFAEPQNDLLAATVIDVGTGSTWDTLRSRERLTFQVRHQSQSPAAIIPSTPCQVVTVVDDRNVRVLCWPILDKASDTLGPIEADLESNLLIQSDHLTIKQMITGLLVADNATTAQKAETLRLAVNRHVGTKNFTHAFLSAAEVAIEAEGDCTEHAILLAALLRASGIPSRVAAGWLLMPPDANGTIRMGYHMWTLYWDGDRWLALDSSMSEQPSFPDRIMLVASNLASGNEYACLLPVLQALGQVTVQLED